MTISLNEQSFVLESLKARLRTDGRESLNDYRSLKISLDHHTGSAQVQLGKTRVLASVSCDIVRPQPHNPTDGILLINTTFSKMSSEQATKSDATSSSDEEILVSRLLERAFKRSRAIDTEGLCIVASEKVWQIRVDIRVLDHEGNVTDCACIAAMSALLSFKRPDVSVQGYDVVIHPTDEKSPIPLSIHHIPIAVTFAFFHSGSIHVVDPTALEESVQESSLTIVTNIHREICCLSKAGGVPIDHDKFMECVQIASQKTVQITEAIKTAIAQSLEDPSSSSMHGNKVSNKTESA